VRRYSTVSRFFQASIRRHIFFCVDLRIISKAHQLRDLLMSAPDIGRHIRKLNVRVSSHWSDRDVKEWFASNSDVLSLILEVVPGLTTFHWYGSMGLVWRDMSSALRSSLIRLFQSPSLTTVQIQYLDFPLSVFHAASSLNTLTFSGTLPCDDDQIPVALPRLEALSIWTNNKHADVQLLVPKLQRISLHGCDERPCALAQQAIDGSAGSLQRLWLRWQCNPLTADAGPAGHIRLDQLRCLRFLTIVVPPFQSLPTGDNDWRQYFQLADFLKDTPAVHTLNDLTIGFKCGRDNIIDAQWGCLYAREAWKDIDTLLFSFPALQRVLIHLHFEHYKSIPAHVWTGLREALPLLAGRGILTFKSNGDTHLERDMFTDEL
jgi:hypothetical protein